MSRRSITIWGAFALLLVVFSTTVFAKEMTVQGRLKRTVEPGGWVIATGNQEYLILNAHSFQNESWFGEGNEVEAVGETRSDVMTTQMQGTPFQVRSMHALTQGSGAGQNESRGLTRGLLTESEGTPITGLKPLCERKATA